MTQAICLSVSGDWLKLAPDVAWHPESQGDDELLTFRRASLGHCSAGQIWQKPTVSLSGVLGGVRRSLRAPGTTRAVEGAQAVVWWPREAQRVGPSCRPLGASFALLPCTSEGTLANSRPVRRKKEHFPPPAQGAPD